MSTRSSLTFLVLIILAFAFAYRFFLMTWNTFPPGADIGLHESVLQSITQEKADFSRNYYHMGGGVSATNPGYHIFVASVVAMTGMPDYFAHSILVSFFSALIVLCVFLIARKLWNETAALLAAFLAVFSSGDLAIMIWGGYPNVVTLMLFPTVFFCLCNARSFRQWRISRRVHYSLEPSS